MFQLVLPKRFKKQLSDFLNKHPELKPVLKEKLEILREDLRDQRLKTHKLSGNLKHCLACSITYEYRLIFYLDKNFIFLLAIGTHDEVY